MSEWRWWITEGDCVESMNKMAANSIDAIVCDPPYEISFDSGKGWDSTGVAFSPDTWAAALHVLKPGGHLLAFSASRTYHRIAVAIEDAGFQIRDSMLWIYGSGMPKGLDVSVAIDKTLGVERTEVREIRHGTRMKVTQEQEIDNKTPITWEIKAPATPEAAAYDGWSTALKPAHEPIVVARKPLTGTVAANVLAHGTGALNVPGCRVEGDRWPANVIFDEDQADVLESQKPGSSKFFYVVKPSAKEKVRGLQPGAKNTHPTIKPVALMRYLVRLVTPPGGTVLDPFCGSGTTLMGAVEEGIRCVGIDMTHEYVEIATQRVASCGSQWVE